MFDAFNADPLIDYHRRRTALDRWVIPQERWTVLTTPLRQAEVAAGRQSSTDWGDRKRLMVSIFLWAEITRGDYLTSPILPRPSVLRRKIVWQLEEVGRVLRAGRPRPNGAGRHTLMLMSALDDYRDRLTRSIEAGQPMRSRGFVEATEPEVGIRRHAGRAVTAPNLLIRSGNIAAASGGSGGDPGADHGHPGIALAVDATDLTYRHSHMERGLKELPVLLGD